MLLYASSIIENIAAGLCMSLVLYDQSSSANQRAHTENRSQNPSQSRHECRCDDTGDTSDQKHPKHQLRYLDMTDGGIRRSEIITVTIHYTIGVQPAGTSEIARSTTLRSVISERALIQILNRKQRLLLSACELANSAHAASKSSAFEEAPSPPFGAAFGRSSSALLLLRSVILITVIKRMAIR